MWWFILVIPGLGRWDRQSPGAGWPVNLALVSPRLMTDLSQSRWTVLLRMTTKNVLWFSCMPTHTGIHSLTHTNECHYGIPYMYVYDVLWPYLPSNNPVLWPCVPPRIPFLFESSPSSISFIPLFFKSRFLTSENMQFLSLWVWLCLQSCDPSQARAHLRLTVSASVIISDSIHFPAGGRTLSFSMAEQNPFVTCPLSFPGPPPKNMYLSSH